MTNHFHVFLKIAERNLSTGMHDVESGYATLFNKRHRRPGPLYQGRFHAVLVESEGHAWSLSRYVHLNPCRAKLAAQPEDYRWSTYRFFLDPRGAPRWLDWRTVLCEFGGTQAAARIAYRRYVEAGLGQPPANPPATAFEGVLLGSDHFIAAHRHLIEDAQAEVNWITQSATIAAVLAAVAEDFRVSSDEIRQSGRHGNLAREAVIWLCRETVRVPLQQIAAAFGGISCGTVTNTVRRCQARQQRCLEFETRCETLQRIGAGPTAGCCSGLRTPDDALPAADVWRYRRAASVRWYRSSMRGRQRSRL